MNKRMRRHFAGALVLMVIFVLSCAISVYADNLDEIEKYEVTAEVNDDATVDLTYHIEWRVLDSYSEGPLSWIRVGLANSHAESCVPISDNIDNIDINNSGAATYADIMLDRDYEEGELIVFEFKVKQGFLYQMNLNEDGYTVFNYTPGWFDSVDIDKLVIRWKEDKVSAWSPDCLIKNGYCTWETRLDAGESYSVEITYPNDAYAFSQAVSDAYEETEYDDAYWDDYEDYYYEDSGFDLMSLVAAILIGISILTSLTGGLARSSYNRGRGFGENSETKITRTRIVYHTNCPNCGAPREEGKDKCQFCGTNLIKSEDVIKEEDMTDEEKEEMKKFRKDGEYGLPSMPDTYIRVHTVHIPVSHSHSHGHRGGGCAHSSCACACASCACACACACAGGGRAGCSNKDFYKNSLKLKQLEKRK